MKISLSYENKKLQYELQKKSKELASVYQILERYNEKRRNSESGEEMFDKLPKELLDDY